MPLIQDPFAGHMPEGDPRGPLSAAGGCTWPTVPAYRYWFISDDATGDLAFFNTNPVVIEFSSPQPAHDLALWTLYETHPDVTAAYAQKLFWPGQGFYRWDFYLTINSIPEAPLLFFITRDNETCNRDLPLPNVWAFDIDRGVTGDTFRLEQIEFDARAPPPQA